MCGVDGDYVDQHHQKKQHGHKPRHCQRRCHHQSHWRQHVQRQQRLRRNHRRAHINYHHCHARCQHQRQDKPTAMRDDQHHHGPGEAKEPQPLALPHGKFRLPSKFQSQNIHQIAKNVQNVFEISLWNTSYFLKKVFEVFVCKNGFFNWMFILFKFLIWKWIFVQNGLWL